MRPILSSPNCPLSLCVLIALLVLFAPALYAQVPAESDTVAEEFTPLYKYRVYLKDKKGTPFSVKHPEVFLSEKAIARRKRQGLKIDQTDLPLNPAYVEAVRQTGVTICHGSKWNNTLVVQTADTALVQQTVAALPCVDSVLLVACYTHPLPADTTDRFALVGEEEPLRRSTEQRTVDDLFDRLSLTEGDSLWDDSLRIAKQVVAKALAMQPPAPPSPAADSIDSPYGKGHEQIAQLGGLSLHEQGFRGQGIVIAILDGGFYNADTIPALRNARIIGTHDFVDTPLSIDVFAQASHGMMVLSCIAADEPNELIGTAPEASFWLLRTEDTHSEQLVEEDNWAAAVEWADSVGADVINSSLGYTHFDAPAPPVHYYELDGQTHLASRSASLLAKKGMVLCNSAGNSADDRFKLIGSPADADDILAVGAVDADGQNTLFSSLGPTADGRVKPDVMARGGRSAVLSVRGNVTSANGTSFASPTLCGLVACFWQANPTLTALQVIEAVRSLGDNASHPDNVFGYGIPDFSLWNTNR